MRTVKDVDVAGKRVLVRVDFNVPLEAGQITDDARIRGALPTINYLLERDARVVLVSHLGRPKDHEPEFSLAPTAERLRELIEAKVTLAPEVVGPAVDRLVDQLAGGEVLLLENVRYEAEETKNGVALARALASLCDVYVNDAFGAAHRAHASTEGITHYAPESVAGLLLAREVETLTGLLEDPKRPLVAVLGGSKVSDKIGVIERFLTVADSILIGGAMCFPLLKSLGHEVGSSLCSDDDLAPAERALAAAEQANCRLELPNDLVIADSFSAEATAEELYGVDIPGNWMGLDIGHRTAQRYADEITQAGTVFWNGPMGAFELVPFDAGTRAVADAVAATEAVTVVGGGDSAAALKAFGYEDSVTHLSTGGGASLELIEGKKLPGVEALINLDNKTTTR